MKITRKNGKQAKLNHDYFETIDTEEKAYFLGLIAADGSIIKHKKSKNGYSHILRLELMASDKYIIERLRDELKSNLQVREYKKAINRDGWKDKHNAYIQFHSKKLFDDLNKYGIGERKTTTLKKLPNLNEEFMRHFIRGFFDGDGCVYINYRYKVPRPHFSFYGTYEFLSDLKEHLVQELNLSNRKVHQKKTQNVSMVTFSTVSDVKNFYDYIYKDATVFLHRKKEKFDLYIDKI